MSAAPPTPPATKEVVAYLVRGPQCRRTCRGERCERADGHPESETHACKSVARSGANGLRVNWTSEEADAELAPPLEREVRLRIPADTTEAVRFWAAMPPSAIAALLRVKPLVCLGWERELFAAMDGLSHMVRKRPEGPQMASVHARLLGPESGDHADQAFIWKAGHNGECRGNAATLAEAMRAADEALRGLSVVIVGDVPADLPDLAAEVAKLRRGVVHACR